MIRRARFDLRIESIDQFITVAREKITEVDLALLQVFIRVEDREETFDLAARRLIAL